MEALASRTHATAATLLSGSDRPRRAAAHRCRRRPRSRPGRRAARARLHLVAGLPLAVVCLVAYLGRRRKARWQRPGPSFHRRIEALHYYFVILAVGLGAAVWTHSDEGLGDALRTVIGGA